MTTTSPEDRALFEGSWASVSPPRVLAVVALVLLPILGLLVVWAAWRAFFLLFAGLLFAVLLDAAIRGLSRLTDLRRRWSFAIVLGTAALLLAAVVGLGGNYLLSETNRLAEALQEQAIRVADLIERLRPGTPAEEGETSWMAAMRDIGSLFWSSAAGPTSFVGSVLGGLANILVIVFIGIFLAVDPDLYRRGAVRLVPPGRRAEVDEALRSAGDVLRQWLMGKLLSMAMIATFTLVGLWAVGYPLAVPLALLAGLLAFVPNIGPILAYIPIALAGLSEGSGTVLAGLTVYAAAQTIESYVFTPMIQKRMVSLAPALILFVQVLGGLLFGLWGIALATPITAVLRLWIERYYIERGLEGEPTPPRARPG